VAFCHIDQTIRSASMARTISMSPNGRLTLPADARRALGIDGETDFEVAVDVEKDELILRPVLALRREDAWAYTPEHRERLARAHADSREGRVWSMSEEDLIAYAEAAEAARQREESAPG
jgi:bifunctional DNA-binding transcriptional regulator/antitoxin component of YhaV-PrlF toxin-antitoxin module